MREPTQPTQPQATDLTAPMLGAKFPPDDSALPPDPPGGGRSAVALDDLGTANFKRGAIGPVAIGIGLLAVGALVTFLFIGFKSEEQRIPVKEAVEIEKQVFVLPADQQIGEWRKWAASDRSNELKMEALKQLAWAKDPDGVDLCITALKHVEEPIRAQAATALAEYGLPLGEKAKPALLEALKAAGAADKPQIAWALVELGEKAAINEIMQLYRIGHLSKVQRLDGMVAFDPNKIVNLISLDELVGFAKDPSAAVRQLVATVLSRHADPKYTDALISLLQDEDKEISRQAAPGLGQIGDERAREPLLKMLRGADKESRKLYLLALRDGVGTKGLVLSLETVDPADPDRAWFQTKQVMDLIEGAQDAGTFGLNDPRGGDSLAGFLEKKPHIHWQTRTAFALAKIGDLRAVPILAKRLRMDPLKIYSDDTDYEMLLKRDDNERVTAARMIADLAFLHPDKVDQIREQSEDAVIFWVHELPSPHANGLRALAAMGSTKDLKAMQDWANPDAPLPKEGQQPPMPEEWVIAQSAMRYVGRLKDEKSWDVFEKALKKRPHEIDVTMESLLQGGLAILGMTLRALGVGASDGMSEWGDPKGFKPLMDYVLEPKENEQAREAACSALAWVATPDDMVKVAETIKKADKPQKNDQFVRSCLLETLIQRPVPGTAPALLELLTPDSELKTRHQVARAIGKAGLDAGVQDKLFEMMNDPAMVNDAALALILGGTPEVAARAVAMYGTFEEAVRKPAIDELQELYYRTFGFWSIEDLEKGRIFRWVDNAVAMSRVEIAQTPQEWARAQLMSQFENLHFDNGPHSFTRVVLRYRLDEMARGQDKELREGAIRTLKFMQEQGVLLALRDAEGETGRLASQAYHELMNPKIVEGVKSFKEEKK
ncbi:MAG: HEAT repeat domain-containing protein [Polyangiaceae bacterium]|nr:HEAT repeat domain-containing protein [Polyangiaceae bacterium]